MSKGKRFQIDDLPLTGLKRIERIPLGDSRGSFARIFCAEELKQIGWDEPIAQINHTVTSKRGVVRGLHFQRPPHAEKKIVNCLRGEIFDVAVDVRSHSQTFLRWHAEVLSASNHRALYIPEGFAHGFQALSADVELLYLHSASHCPEAEDGLDAVDPMLRIDWPINITERSKRDTAHDPLSQKKFQGVEES